MAGAKGGNGVRVGGVGDDVLVGNGVTLWEDVGVGVLIGVAVGVGPNRVVASWAGALLSLLRPQNMPRPAVTISAAPPIAMRSAVRRVTLP